MNFGVSLLVIISICLLSQGSGNSLDFDGFDDWVNCEMALLFISIIWKTISCLMLSTSLPKLVTVEAYRHIRHPLYSSLLFLAWGVFFKHITWVCAFGVVVTTLLLTLTAKIDEIENIHFWGAAYEKYMKRSKMFIPFLF